MARRGLACRRTGGRRVGIPSLCLWCRRDGIPHFPGNLTIRAVLGPSRSEAPPEARVVVERLGICLPCQVIPADLRITCASAHRSARLLTLPYSTQTARPVRRANRWLPVGGLV